MTSDLDILKHVHFTQSHNGLVPRDFKIDPSKVQEVKRDRENPRKGEDGEKLLSFRYVVAIEGETRAKAAHEFHDRILHFPTKHGIFALYRTQIGVAQLMLNVSVPLNGGADEIGPLSPKQIKDMERVESFRSHLHGHKMLVIRGAFKNERDFIEALGQAAQSRPGEHLPIPQLTSLFFDTAVYDPLIVASDALKTVGTISQRVPPNIPGHQLARLAGEVAFNSGSRIEAIADGLQQFSLERKGFGSQRL